MEIEREQGRGTKTVIQVLLPFQLQYLDYTP